MNANNYGSKKLEIIQELARLEKIGWGNDDTDSTIFPYVIIEAINILMNSRATEVVTDFAGTGDHAYEMINDIWSTIDCGNGCCFENPGGFVPAAGCKIHD